MSSRLAGKVAIITGSGKGIGKVVAQFFAKEGAKVVVVSLHEETGSKVCDEIRATGGDALFVRADVTKQADMERMMRKNQGPVRHRPHSLSQCGDLPAAHAEGHD